MYQIYKYQEENRNTHSTALVFIRYISRVETAIKVVDSAKEDGLMPLLKTLIGWISMCSRMANSVFSYFWLSKSMSV